MARIKVFKSSAKRILLIIISVILSIGAIIGIGALVTNAEEETQKTISSFEFGQGGLNSSGKFEDNKKYIYTKEAFSCKGLEVEVDFENDITYAIYFYDELGDCINSLTTKFNSDSYSLNNEMNSWEPSEEETDLDNPYLKIRSCRIVVQSKSDDSIAFYEVNKYANQLTIKVDKRQRFDDLIFDNVENK